MNPYDIPASTQQPKQVRLRILFIGIPILAGVVSTLALFYAFLVLYVNYNEYVRLGGIAGATPIHLFLLVLLILGSLIGLACSTMQWRSGKYISSFIAFVLALVGLTICPWFAIIMTCNLQ